MTLGPWPHMLSWYLRQLGDDVWEMLDLFIRIIVSVFNHYFVAELQNNAEQCSFVCILVCATTDTKLSNIRTANQDNIRIRVIMNIKPSYISNYLSTYILCQSALIELQTTISAIFWLFWRQYLSPSWYLTSSYLISYLGSDKILTKYWYTHLLITNNLAWAARGSGWREGYWDTAGFILNKLQF